MVETNGNVRVRWAGQLFVQVPIMLSSEGYDRHFTVGEVGLYASYDEWNSTSGVLFSAQSDLGWVDVRVRATTDSLYEVDAEVSLGFVDARQQGERSVSGVLFGGQVRVSDVPSSVSTSPSYDRYGHRRRGCGGDTYVGVDNQPTYGRSDSGCAGDEIETDDDDDESYNRDSGCGNDSVNDDSGPSCVGERYESDSEDEEDGGNESLSCAGDDTGGGDGSSDDTDDDDDDDDENRSSDLHCAGDDIDNGSMSAIPIGRSLRRHGRPLSVTLFRTFHIWSPFVFVFLFRRRHRAA